MQQPHLGCRRTGNGGGELRGEYEERWKFADKPGSVVDSHSSGPDVTAKL